MRAAALAVAAVLAAGCSRGPGPGAGSAGKEFDDLRPLMRGVHMTHVVKGRTELEIFADEASTSLDGRSVEGKGVRAVYHRAGGKLAVLRSNSARYDMKRKVLNASGGVRVDAENGRLDAASLVWDAANNRLTSTGKVRVTKGGNVLTGRGLDADPELEQVVIKEDVRILAAEPDEFEPLMEELEKKK